MMQMRLETKSAVRVVFTAAATIAACVSGAAAQMTVGGGQGDTRPAMSRVPSYKVYRLPDLLPGPDHASYAASINNQGNITGSMWNAADERGGGVWLRRGAFGLNAGPNIIESPWSDDARAVDMNRWGQIVGSVAPPAGEEGYSRAFRWDPGTGMVNLGVSGVHDFGQAHSVAAGINDNGIVVGHTTIDSTEQYYRPFWHAFYHDGVDMNILPCLGTDGHRGAYAKAFDINNANQIVGMSTYENPDAPIWDPLVGARLSAALWLLEPAFGLEAGVHDLVPAETLDPEIAEFGYSVAEAINDKGQILISYPEFGSDLFHIYHNAAIWLPEPDYGMPAGMNQLGWFQGKVDKSTAHRDINNLGEIVGQFDASPPGSIFIDWQAYLRRDGIWYDLQYRIPFKDQGSWFLDAAMSINDRSEIVGWGMNRNTETGVWEQAGWLLSPYPQILGDFSQDGTVDMDDLSILLGNMGRSDARPIEGDINDDDVVDFFDLMDFVESL